MKAALQTLRSALEAADPAPILAMFADGVQLQSPALIGPPEYRGRDVVGPIVTLALRVLGGVRVTDVLASEDGTTGGVVFDARIQRTPAQGVVVVRANGDQVTEITLLIRPLPALRAFVDHMEELGAQPALDAREARDASGNA